MPCAKCGGRVIKSGEGQRCMSSACGWNSEMGSDQLAVQCPQCDVNMLYDGLNQLGEPKYRCPQCRKSIKL